MSIDNSNSLKKIFLTKPVSFLKFENKLIKIEELEFDDYSILTSILVDLLNDKNYKIRFKSAWMLTQILDKSLPSFAEGILNIFQKERNRTVRYFIGELLKVLKAKGILDCNIDLSLKINIEEIEKEFYMNPPFSLILKREIDVKEIYTNPNGSVVSGSCFILVAGDKQFEDEFLQIIQSDEPKVKKLGMYALSEIKSRKAVPFMKEAFQIEKNENKRIDYLIYLSRILPETSKWFQTLVEKNKQEKLRDNQVRDFFKICENHKKKKWIKYYLVNPEITLEANIIEFMNKKQIIDFLNRVEEHGPEVFNIAIVIRRILEEDTRIPVKVKAAKTLANLGDKDAIEIIQDIIKNPRYKTHEKYFQSSLDKLLEYQTTDEYVEIIGEMNPFIFLAGVHDDKNKSQEIEVELNEAGLDNVHLYLSKETPGEKHAQENDMRIKASDYFIACFSTNTAKKNVSLFHREVKIALKRQLMFKPGIRFFIPIKLDKCEIPKYVVETENIKDFTYARDYELDGVRKLINSIKDDWQNR